MPDEDFPDGPDDDEEDDYDEARLRYEAAQRERLAKQEPHVQAGMAAIQGMLKTYGAVGWGEMIARATDYPWEDSPRRSRVDQHHLRTALSRLVQQRLVTHTASRTRGGREIGVFHAPITPGNRRQIETASARKRLLEARYLGWASGTDIARGVIGAAAEDTVHSSLREAAPQVGYRVLDALHGTASVVDNVPVPSGALDNAAVAHFPEMPNPVLLAIEVKSHRPWVYPSSADLYQLLFKAASLSELMPGYRILPVFICRRAHITTYRMARDLGFHVIDTLGIQWLPRLASIEDAAVVEVRQELGYVDLRFAKGANSYLVKQLASVIPSIAALRTSRWLSVGSRFAAVYRALWQRLRELEGVVFEDYPLNVLRDRALGRIELLPREERGEVRVGGW